MKSNFEIYDGTKSIPLNALPPEAWTDVVGGDHKDKRQKLYSAVGILNRCLSIRANSFAALPWSISKGDNKIYDSEGGILPPNLMFMKNFRRNMFLVEASLVIYASSYLFINDDKKLQWMISTSMKPLWNKETGLYGFERTLSQTDKRNIPIEKIVYTSLPNPFDEIKAGASPFESALSSAGVILNLDTFAEKFFERGAIKATVLKVDANTPPNERARVKSWWKNFVSGVKNSWSTEIISTAVEPVVIGEGLGEIADANLTDSKAKTIATSLGIPHSMAFSDAANFATALADEKGFYTHTILPDANLVEEELNEKIFSLMGYTFSFDEEELASFQENEKDRALVVKTYVDSGMPLSVAVQIAGVKLPDGVKPEDLDPEEPEPVEDPTEPIDPETPDPKTPMDNAPKQDVQNQNMPMNKSIDKEYNEEIDRFSRWLNKRIKFVKSWTLSDFESEYITTDDKLNILKRQFKYDKTLNIFEDDEDEHFEKALVLQSNPDDDEDEQKQARKIEDKVTKILADELASQKEVIFVGNESKMDLPPEYVDMGKLMDAPARIDELSGKHGTARDALRQALMNGVDLGVATAVKQFETVGFSFDWTLTNKNARDWAEQHSSELIRGIDATTKEHVRQQIGQWINNGDPLSALNKSLEITFGKKRAELIASTEVTRSFAEANNQAYKDSGVVKKIEWRTAKDELVCPICGPLSGKKADINKGFDKYNIPPAHPRCRCWIVPVIEGKQ